MDTLVQRDAFYYEPGKTKTPLDVFETAHNVRSGQWYTFTLETGRGARCVVSFANGFRYFHTWKEKIGPVFVQRDRNGLVSAVKQDL